MVSDNMCRCFRRAGVLSATMNFGREIYKVGERCNCLLSIDNERSGLSVVGVTGRLVKRWTVRIQGKYHDKKTTLMEDFKDILVVGGEKGCVAIGSQISGDNLVHCEGEFLSNTTWFEIELKVAGNYRCCCTGKQKIEHQIWVVDPETYNPVESLMEYEPSSDSDLEY